MLQRNWLQLARKLVDQYDMDYTVEAIAAAIDENTLAYFGEGVFISTTYPFPFPVTLSGSVLGGSVGNGIGFDVNGQITRIDPSSSTSKNFTAAAADPTHARWDLLVIRYVQTGDTPIPKPSDPISTIDLNLHDDFHLATVTGTPSASPAYPSKGTNDIILGGLRVPANATLGTQCTLDLSIREMAQQSRASLASFVHESIGAGNNSNHTFTLSQTPLNIGSLLVIVDEVALSPVAWSLSGKNVFITIAPSLGQTVDAYYVANDPQSQNPLSGQQEDIGTGDGSTLSFALVGQPANQGSTLVMKDGEIVSPSKWGLVQSVPSQILFSAGNAPGPGEEITVFYLVNASTVGIGLDSTSDFPIFRNEFLVDTGDHQNFTLSAPPLSAQALFISTDGLLTTEWTLTSALNVQFTAPLGTGVRPYARYLLNSQTFLAAAQEVPSNPSGDMQTYMLAGNPVNQSSLYAFVDGRILDASTYTLVLGGGGAIVELNAPLGIGQKFYVGYFQPVGSTGGNVTGIQNLPGGQGLFKQLASGIAQFKPIVAGSDISVTPIGDTLVIAATGGSGSSEEIHGSALAPVAVDPTVGLVPSTASAQLWFVEPSSGTGEVDITAAPPISPGGRDSVTGVGDKLRIKTVANSNYLKFPDVAGVDQPMDMNTGPFSQAAQWTWDGQAWSEDFRKV